MVIMNFDDPSIEAVKTVDVAFFSMDERNVSRVSLGSAAVDPTSF